MRANNPNPTPPPRVRLCAYADCKKIGEITVYHPEHARHPGAPLSRGAFCCPLHLVLWELQQMKKGADPSAILFLEAVNTADWALDAFDVETRRAEGSAGR